MLNKMKDKPRLSNSEAAIFIGCSPSTMKISRVTGRLLGKAAPSYRKLGKKVAYDLTILQEWLEQFANQKNTAA